MQNRVINLKPSDVEAFRAKIFSQKLLSWQTQGKTVELYYRDGSLEADVISEGNKVMIPFHDIEGLTIELREKPEFIPFFLSDSYIRLADLKDGSYKLYICSRLHGGGRNL